MHPQAESAGVPQFERERVRGQRERARVQSVPHSVSQSVSMRDYYYYMLDLKLFLTLFYKLQEKKVSQEAVLVMNSIVKEDRPFLVLSHLINLSFHLPGFYILSNRKRREEKGA